MQKKSAPFACGVASAWALSWLQLPCFLSTLSVSLIGASADTWAPTQTYLSIVFLGGPFVLISNCYSNILRAEGQASKAMMGQVVGNLLNIILDPIMISVFDWALPEQRLQPSSETSWEQDTTFSISCAGRPY